MQGRSNVIGFAMITISDIGLAHLPPRSRALTAAPGGLRRWAKRLSGATAPALSAGQRLCRCPSGSAAVEFSIVSLLLVVLSLGIVEFGRGLYVRNQLSYAADLVARKVLLQGSAAVPTLTQTGLLGTALTTTSSATAQLLDSVLETDLRAAFTSGDPGLLQVVLGTETADGIAFRTVSVSYPMPLLVPGLVSAAINLRVARRIPLV